MLLSQSKTPGRQQTSQLGELHSHTWELSLDGLVLFDFILLLAIPTFKVSWSDSNLIGMIGEWMMKIALSCWRLYIYIYIYLSGGLLKKILCTILMNIPRKWVKAVIFARKCWSKLTPSGWSCSRRHRLPKPCIFQVSKWLDSARPLPADLEPWSCCPNPDCPHHRSICSALGGITPQPIHLPGQQMPYAWLGSTGHFGADLGLQRCHRHHQATPMF